MSLSSDTKTGWLNRMLALPNDSIQKTLFVAISLCLVCAVLVASAAVLLKPAQVANQALNRKAIILEVAGLRQPGQDVNEAFQQVEARIVDLDTGEYTEAFDPATYDLRKATKDPNLSERVPPDLDIANIKSKAKYAPVYLIREGEEIKTIILPVHGYGLWSTMYGFLALAGDTKTVKGLKFYEHAETPGLGGEIDNAGWLEQWQGKVVYDEQWQPDIQVVKGVASKSGPEAQHQVDGLAGATITARAVMYLLQYWLSDQGFGHYLERLRTERV